MGGTTPSICAGHSMLCPYEEDGAARRQGLPGGAEHDLPGLTCAIENDAPSRC